MLRATLRLAHPVLPHVTERIWGELGEDGVLARSSWPDQSGATRDVAAERAVEQAFDFVVKLRQLRTAAKLPPRAPLAVQGWPLAQVVSLVEALGGVTHRSGRRGGGVAPLRRAARRRRLGHRARARAGTTTRGRVCEQELAKADAEIERARRKLADARFVERAPAQLVQEERDKLERFEREAAELRDRLDALGA